MSLLLLQCTQKIRLTVQMAYFHILLLNSSISLSVSLRQPTHFHTPKLYSPRNNLTSMCPHSFFALFYCGIPPPHQKKKSSQFKEEQEQVQQKMSSVRCNVPNDKKNSKKPWHHQMSARPRYSEGYRLRRHGRVI